MSDRRPFPPSARRTGLARRAGLTAASPLVVAAGAWVAGALALVAGARVAAALLGDAIAAAARGASSADPASGLLGAPRAGAAGSAGGRDLADPGALTTLAAVPHAVAAIALPVVLAVAAAAIATHLAQTRAPWLPRRRIAGAPQLDRGPGARGSIAARELALAVGLGGAAFGWLWIAAPQLARLPSLRVADALPAAAALVAGFVTTVAAVLVAAGALDAVARAVEIAGALRMTDAERREDARLADADPRWRARREAAARGLTAREAVAQAAVVLVGDDTAVAIAWDPRRRPLPSRLATGRGAPARTLAALARRHRVALHRDAALADRLAGADGPVPEADWPRLAEIVAAIRPR